MYCLFKKKKKRKQHVRVPVQGAPGQADLSHLRARAKNTHRPAPRVYIAQARSQQMKCIPGLLWLPDLGEDWFSSKHIRSAASLVLLLISTKA